MKTRDELVEAMAEAINSEDARRDMLCLDDLEQLAPWRDAMAGAAFSALSQWLAEEGLVVVPRDSTMQMCQQGDCTTAMAFEGGYQCEAEAVWDRMIAAAPDALKTKP